SAESATRPDRTAARGGQRRGAFHRVEGPASLEESMRRDARLAVATARASAALARHHVRPACGVPMVFGGSAKALPAAARAPRARFAGSVSYMRASTSAPEANVSPPLAAIAQETPSTSASTPASTAPTA